MSEPTMEQMLDAYYSAVIADNAQRMTLAHRAILARFAELERERDEAREGWHMANGVAELAMKHRDMSEADAERWQYVRQFDCVEIAYGEVVDLSVGSETDAGPRNDTAIDAARAEEATRPSAWPHEIDRSNPDHGNN